MSLVMASFWLRGGLRGPAPRGRRTGWCLAPALVVAGLVGGCADDAFDLRNHTTFVPEDRAFRIRYLKPPWQLNSDGTEAPLVGIVQLIVESPLLSVEIPDTESPGEEFFTYNLLIARRRGDPERLALQDARRVRDSLDTLILEPTPFVTDDGDAGFEVIARTFALPTRFRRSIYLPGVGAGDVFHLRLLGFPNLDDDPESDRMLRSFEVGPIDGGMP